MAATPKPDASYASVRLTRSNYNQPPLLSTVAGKTTRRVPGRNYKENSGSDSSEDPLATDKCVTRTSDERATDDDPASTTDEDESQASSPQLDNGDDDAVGFGPEHRRRRVSGWSPEALQSELARGDAQEEEERKRKENGRSTTGNKAEGKNGTPRTAIRRSNRAGAGKNASPEAKRAKNATASDSKGSNDEDGDLFPSLFGTPKRRKVTQRYTGSSRNIHASAPRSKYGVSKSKPPTSMANASDEAVHSSQEMAGAAEFKDRFNLAMGDMPSSSFPTEASHGNENETLFDVDVELDPEGSISPLSSVSSSASHLLSAEEKSRLNPVTPLPARCPVCNELADEEFSNKIQLLKGQSTKEQMEFCREHRIRTAQRDWVENGYPTINWEELDFRIERHFSELEQILTHQVPSFYRDLLKSSAQMKPANLRLTAGSESLDDLSPGYYGARGSKKMSDAIISQFATKLREIAPSDPLMQVAGISAYVQSVLVPELTVMLVKEDMAVNDEGARQIMKQSMKIGDLLNEAPDDVVKRRRRRRSIAN